ncbi:MAG: transporter [Deltaproteobacteria bacterium]|nr:transporter [Deltaproteobacteria bacterium]
MGAVTLSLAAAARAQDLGHKVPGTLGLYAGRVPEPGLYLADQLAFYTATKVRDRSGQLLPVEGFDLDALANGFGLSFTLQAGATRFTAAVSAPLAHVSLSSDRPEASIDQFGLADARVQPVGLGWRSSHLDLVTSYALYIPTTRFEPGGRGGGLGRGSFSHELSAGGTVFFDQARRWYLSALASYELNHRKIGTDITRGDTVQIQGGAGVKLLRIFDLGVAGYALWQVRDDRGSELPAALRGARDRVFGLGPEIGAAIAPIRTRIVLRYGHDFGVQSRPDGQILTLTVAFLAWQPDER